MRALRVLALVLWALPLRAAADRGALALDAGAVLSGSRIPPGAGEGSAVSGTMGGVSLALRYAVRNDFELTVRAEWFKAAPFFHDDTTVRTTDGVFVGQAQARVGRHGAAAGLRYVRGLVWRIHAGIEIGWTRFAFESMDLVDMSDPATPRTFGLALGSPAVNGLLIAPVLGVEWAVTDHLSFSVTPRIDFVATRPDLSGFTVPIIVSWSWYGFGR